MVRTILFIACLTMFLDLNGQVSNGSIDLSGFDFSKTPVLELNGEWRYAENQFISPYQAKDLDRYHEVPGLWETPRGYATYALSVILPRGRPVLGLQVPDIYTSYQLTINGQYVDIKGYAGMSAEESIPFRQIKNFNVPQQYDSIEIVLHVSNFHHNKGGIKKAVIIGDLIYLEQQLFLSRTFDAFIGGCLMMGFFFFLGLYLYGKHDRTSLYFSLFCLSYAVRICFSENYMINLINPTFPWELQITIEYLTLYFNTIFFAYFVYFLFPGVLPKWLVRFFGVESFIFILLAILTPPFFFTGINNVHLMIIIPGMSLITLLILRSAYLRKQDWVYSLLSIVGFLTVVSIQALDYFDVVKEVLWVSFAGQIIFFLSNALVLSNHYSRSWQEAAVRAKQSEEAKSNFLSVMSHEIRTPLNSLIGTTQYLIEHGPKQEQISELKNLKLSADNLLNIVNNILDFNKIESRGVSLESNSINLHEFLHHMIDQNRKFAAEKGLTLEAVVDPGIGIVQLDETRLIQVVGNLLNNAIKFTDEGTVQVRVDRVEQANHDTRLKFSVTDTGIGIGHKEQKLILDPFQQVSSSDSRKYGGTGLGLTITKKLLEIMGSDLEIQSTPGKGSSFSFSLESIKGEATPVVEVDRDTKDLMSTRILLVDDHDLNVLMTTNFLQKWNAEVTVAGTGREAIDQVRDNTFDIILMDIQMPGMDGFEATRIIRENGFTGPIIAVTADVYQEADEIIRKGMNDQINKPFDPDTLYRTIKDHLDGALTPQQNVST